MNASRLEAFKLELVLDLDHTLLHAVEAQSEHVGHPPSGVHAFFLARPSGGESRYFVRTRDALHSFLHQLQTFSKLHVYTMASKSYTRHVLNAIDPGLNIFNNKILCREDGQAEIFDKSLTHIELKQERDYDAAAALVVVDDREDAWDPSSRDAVLQVHPFRCFSNGGTSLPEEEWRPDTVLMDVLRVLRKVHLDWSSGTEPSARAALQSYRCHVLQGVQLVLSGGLLQDADQPQRCLYWRLAESLGATCHLSWTTSTPVTHVVSGRPDTGSVQKAVSMQVHAVRPEWLLDSARRWRRQAESLYTLRPEAKSSDDPPLYAFGDESELSADRLADIIPPSTSLPDTDRLKAAIKFIVPVKQRAQTDELFKRFEEHLKNQNEAGKKEVLSEITSLVGMAKLVKVLQVLEIK